MRKILLYGDVNPNIIDGSSIWLQSMAEALAGTNSQVTVLLKTNVVRNGFLDRISGLPNIDIIQPFIEQGSEPGGELAPRSAAQRLVQLDEVLNFDLVICRGLKVCAHVVNSTRLCQKSWLYMTDIPHPVSNMDDKQLKQLRKIVASSKRMFAQTRDAQSYLEAIAPEACGKTLILNPMVPDEFFEFPLVRSAHIGTRLVYSGKFAKDWRTLEMCQLPIELGKTDIDSSITMVGDKFQIDPKDPEWVSRMEKNIQNEGVNWLGGMTRDSAAAVVAEHDVSLSWRSRAMDSSFEISTKVLESAAMGVPPLVNRNAGHEELFGAEYPLFLDLDDTGEVVRVLSRLGPVSDSLRRSVRESVASYSISASASRLEEYFKASEANYLRIPKGSGKTRVLLASHDFKFAGELVDILSVREDIELRFDHWSSLHSHDIEESTALNEWADVVVCEWAGPNAAWYSQNKRFGQKLIVRLHMFELRGPWLGRIDVAAIDTLVCVSALYEERVRCTEGWENSNIRIIPNAVDGLDLFRSKFKGSEYRLGMVGIVPIRKRLDRAVDLMRGLLDRNERYTLHVRGRMPWEYPYEWKKATQQLAYRQIFSEIGSDERLLNSIVFEPFGADMGSWMRKIGFMLSPSSDESFHLAPAEGMASGAVPVFWPRPGVGDIFGDRWMIKDTDEAINFVDGLAKDAGRWATEASAARDYTTKFEVSTVAEVWLEEILSIS